MKINLISESEFFPKGHGVHTAYLNHVAMLKKLNIEVVTNSLKKADVVHIETIGPLGLYKLLTSKKTVVSAHVIPASFEGSLIGATYWLGAAKSYLRFFYNKASLVLAVGPKVKTQLNEIGVTQKIEIFPNAIDTIMFRNDEKLRILGRKHFGLNKDNKVVLSVGQVQIRKGIEDFIKIAQQLPKFTFIWVGNKPFKMLTAKSEELQQLLKSPPKNFILAGGVPYLRMPQVYNAADIFFLPSYQENASMAIIEAASCGLPLVLRDLAEYQLLYKEGYLNCSNNKEFKENIQGLFSDKKLFEKQSKASLLLAQKFSFEALGNKLLQYYQNL